MNFLGLTIDQWLQIGISLLFILVAIVAGRWLVRLFLDRILGRMTRFTDTKLDDMILDAIQTPLYWVIILIVFKASINRLDFLPETWEAPLSNLYFVLDTVVGFVLIWRLVKNLFIWYGQEMSARTETNLDDQLMPFFRRVALVFLSLIGLIILFGRFVDVSSLIATLGVGSLAIALAAQAALEDTISGFIIMIDRPYRIGDRVELQDLNTWGDVIDVGLRSTRIRTRDNRTVIIPNSIMAKSLIVNHSFPNNQYRIEVNIGLAYGTDIELARHVLIDSVRHVEGVVKEQPVEALFLQFGDSALVFRVRWWIDSYVDTRRMFDSVNTAMYHALNEAGIEIPFPQMEVQLSSRKNSQPARSSI